MLCPSCGKQSPDSSQFCLHCGARLPGATSGIPADEALKWKEAFASMGWFRKIGSKGTKILADLNPPLDASKETVLFVVYPGSPDHIQDVRIDDARLRRDCVGAIGTDRRIIFLDADQMRFYAYPYEDLARVEKPVVGGVVKEHTYSLHTKSGHTIAMTVRMDARGLTTALSDFGNPDTVGQVVKHKRRAEEVVKFLNRYFTRIVP